MAVDAARGWGGGLACTREGGGGGALALTMVVNSSGTGRGGGRGKASRSVSAAAAAAFPTPPPSPRFLYLQSALSPLPPALLTRKPRESWALSKSLFLQRRTISFLPAF